MNAYDLSRALLTFYEVFREEAISAEDKLALFRDMLATVPAELACVHKGARAVLFNTLERAISDHVRQAQAQKPEPKAARKDAPKQGHASRK